MPQTLAMTDFYRDLSACQAMAWLLLSYPTQRY
jgi:hypothetical protein